MTVIRICAFYDVFLGFCVHRGKQDIQHGNKLVVVCVSTSSYGREDDLVKASGNR